MRSIEKHNKSGQRTIDGYAYLTKRLTIRLARRGSQAAAEGAMTVMGFVITVKDGWLIKEQEDGRCELLQKVIS